MNQKPRSLRVTILHSLCEGMSQRSCERVFGVSQNTVAKLFEETGDWAIAKMKSLKNLQIAKMQADEIHSFVGAKETNVENMIDPPEGAGRVWTYLAMCTESKLIIEYHLGDQSSDDATKFLRKLAGKLARKDNGEFVVRPHMATDGLKAYPDAINKVFGSDIDYGILSKQYSKTDKAGNKAHGARYAGAMRLKGSGEWREEDTHTSYIERQNLNLRMGNRRFNRKTNAFSKTLLNHERHIALWAVYHNFCWVPRPARPPKGTDGTRPTAWVKRLPAAIAAGIDNRLWEVGDMLDSADEFTALRRPESEAEDSGGGAGSLVVPAAEVVPAPTHWVYHSLVHRTTKVHAAGCSNCRDGQGRKGGAQTSGAWLPYYCLDDAIAASIAIQPDDHSQCNMCLGGYFKRGYY